MPKNLSHFLENFNWGSFVCTTSRRFSLSQKKKKLNKKNKLQENDQTGKEIIQATLFQPTGDCSVVPLRIRHPE